MSIRRWDLALLVWVAAIALQLPLSALAACTSQPSRTPNSRYTINGETVYDKKTQLTWSRCSVGQHWQEGSGCSGDIKQLTWQDAAQQAGNGWRVPTKDELASLISPTCKNPAINEVAFPGMDQSKLTYWTSSISGGEMAWGIDFSDGAVYSGYEVTNTNSVRLVRE